MTKDLRHATQRHIASVTSLNGQRLITNETLQHFTRGIVKLLHKDKHGRDEISNFRFLTRLNTGKDLGRPFADCPALSNCLPLDSSYTFTAEFVFFMRPPESW